MKNTFDEQESFFSIDPEMWPKREEEPKDPKRTKRRTEKGIQKRLDELKEIQEENADASDIAYLLTIFANCFLPRTNIESRVYKQKAGNYGLLITGGAATNPETGETIEQPLPYGSKARLFMSYINSEAIRTKNDTVYLGDSLRDLIYRVTGQKTTGGNTGNLKLWKQQLMAFGTCNIAIEDIRPNTYAQKRFNIINEFRMWFDEDSDSLFSTTLKLDKEYFTLLERQGAFPCDQRVLRKLADYTLAYDIYTWLCYRMNYIRQQGMKDIQIPWPSLKKQFGQEYKELAQFKFQFKKALETALAYYPQAKVVIEQKQLILKPSPLAIPERGNFQVR